MLDFGLYKLVELICLLLNILSEVWFLISEGKGFMLSLVF